MPPQGLIIQFAPFCKKQEGLTQAAGRRLLERRKLPTSLMRQMLGIELQPVGIGSRLCYFPVSIAIASAGSRNLTPGFFWFRAQSLRAIVAATAEPSPAVEVRAAFDPKRINTPNYASPSYPDPPPTTLQPVIASFRVDVSPSYWLSSLLNRSPAHSCCVQKLQAWQMSTEYA